MSELVEITINGAACRIGKSDGLAWHLARRISELEQLLIRCERASLGFTPALSRDVKEAIKGVTP